MATQININFDTNNYTTSNPIDTSPGSLETVSSAFGKIVLEFERLYRLINQSNLNLIDLSNKMVSVIGDVENGVTIVDTKLATLETDLKNYIDNEITTLTSTVTSVDGTANDNRIEVFGTELGIANNGIIPIPSGYTKNQCVFTAFFTGGGNVITSFTKKGKNDFSTEANYGGVTSVCAYTIIASKGYNYV